MCALGLEERLVGISHSCDYPPSVNGLPRLSRPRTNLEGLSSGEIDVAIRTAMRDYGSVYEVDLDAHDLAAIFQSIRDVGGATGASERGEALIAEMQQRIARVRDRVAGRPRPRVLALEWLDPPYVPGHWVPELVAAAGGELLAGTARRPSYRMEWADLQGLEPDVLLVMPCGFNLEETQREAISHKQQLRAVGGRVQLLDASAYFSRSGPRVVDGLEILASAIFGS